MTKSLLAAFLLAGLLVSSGLFADVARAHGGAEPMPLTNFTDLPAYRPVVAAACRKTHRKCLAVHRD
jgi:hypothetical protein